MTQNILWQSIKLIIIDLIGEVLYFPVWWYSQGLFKTAIYVFGSIKSTSRNLALSLMIKSLFKPMFAQYDRTGRIISFFMRLLLLVARSVFFIFTSVFYCLFLIFWIILPVFIVWGLTNNISIIWKR